MSGSWRDRWHRLHSGLWSEWAGEISSNRLPRWLSFWVHVFREFSRNRCQVRAAGLAYSTLLALVPLLAVSIAVASMLFDVNKAENRRWLSQSLEKLVNYVAPALGLEDADEDGNARRAEVANNILAYVGNINFTTIGVTAAVGLIIVAISMLRTIEFAFNDIWSVTQGRGWFRSIVLYWAAITLGPMLLVVIKSLSLVGVFNSTSRWVHVIPGPLLIILSSVVPLVLLTLTFASLYRLMPNTQVRWSAALLGATVAAALWWVNNLAANLYNSKVVTYSKIYGSLGILPLFLAGLYLSWLILLLGAETAYVYQHRDGHLEDRRADQVDQSGRELAAIRIMFEIGRSFAAGQAGPDLDGLAGGLGIPVRLTGRLLIRLRRAGLVSEVTPVPAPARGWLKTVREEPRYAPARPLSQITLAEIWRAVRVHAGGDLPLPDEPLARAAMAEFAELVEAAELRGRSATLAELVGRVPLTNTNTNTNTNTKLT